MSTVMVMDAEPANHCVHGNSGEKNPSSSAHQMNMVLLWFWLSWLPPHRPGRCWTMDQLEFKCGAALGPALGAEPPHSGWSPCRDGCPLLPSHGLDHMQAFLPCPRGWIVAGMWEGTWWNCPFGMAWWQRGSTGRKQLWKADEGKLSPAPQALVTPSWVHSEGFSLKVRVLFHLFSSIHCTPS